MTADFTERKRAEDSARNLRDELARMGRVTTMGELAATIAHEVNQPLGAILTNTEVCQNLLNEPSPDHEEIQRALGDIGNDASRATRIVAQVREFLGKTESRNQLVDMNAVIRQVLRMLDDRIRSDQILVALHLGPELPRVWGSENRLQQVVLNLLTNAIEAVGQGRARPRKVTVTSESAGVASLLIKVQDNGVGIPVSDRDRLFTPFFTTKPLGIGMGLPICRSIVEEHQGRLWAESSEGAGSVFSFTLSVGKAGDG
jgi:C4-dicarboxylate-specific signal transduction histidine kinase